MKRPSGREVMHPIGMLDDLVEYLRKNRIR